MVCRVLFDFERAEMGLDLHFKSSPDGIAAVSLSCVGRWHSPRVPTEAASAIFESAGMNDLSGFVDDPECRLRDFLAVDCRARLI